MRPSQWGNQREIRLMRQQEGAGRAGRSKAGAFRRQTLHLKAMALENLSGAKENPSTVIEL